MRFVALGGGHFQRELLVVSALAALQHGPYQVRSLQEYHEEL